MQIRDLDCNKKKQEAYIETAKIKFLRSSRLHKGRPNKNAKIREEPNIFNLNAKIIKYRSQWKHQVQCIEYRF
jgi:hypothetical protein